MRTTAPQAARAGGQHQAAAPKAKAPAHAASKPAPKERAEKGHEGRERHE
jgi:hypothetical protein